MLNQIVSVIGAAIVLGAYLGLQRGWLSPHTRSYNALNFFGALMLLWIAVADQRAGFIMIEGAWALLSVPGMLKPKVEKN